MKKFLWFLVGMAVIISIPIILFSPGTPPREAPPKAVPQKEIEVRDNKGQKPGPASDSSKKSLKDIPKIDSRK